MKRRLSILFGVLFVLGTLLLAVDHNVMQKRVLIIHSYDPEYSWTRDVNSGLQRVLNTYPEWSVRWHYMDLKRRPWADARHAAGTQARRVVEDWNPDVIIAIDDDAQALVGSYYVNHPHIKIVFAGVNGGVDDYGYVGAKNVAGVFERKQLAAVRDALLAGHAKAKGPHATQALRIMHLGDQSNSVKLDDKSIRTFNWAPLSYVGSKLVRTFTEWQTAVLAAGQDADALFVSNYRRLVRYDCKVDTSVKDCVDDPKLVSPREVVAWTEINSPVPIIGGNGFYVEDGGMFALGPSGFEQGSEAANLAVQIIVQEASPDSLLQTSTREFVVFMRRTQMAAHDFNLPDLYEAFARAMNNYFD
ncbi:MAG TPA: hypothetical protein VL381_05790 [Rhodocyclaceae bacterium]|jgi:ABC-type uncharacterized transport system substrate-binding protein|nr:hypothetical protein [Rhodocyclaceae bacterium]